MESYDKKKAIDFVTVDIEYDRPKFEFPLLDGQDGNPLVYWTKMINELSSAGFRKEAQDLIKYYSHNIFAMNSYAPKIKYEDQFNFMAHYVDFSEGFKEKIKEDDEFVYLKVRKSDVKKITQNKLFNIADLSELKKLIKSGEDFSVTNCYGRTFFHYIKSPVVLKFMIEENRKHQWVDLFQLDNFQGSILACYDNLNMFSMVLDEMNNKNKELSNLLLFGKNIFGDNAFGVFLKELDLIFGVDSKIKTLNFKELTNSLAVLKKVSPEKTFEIITTIKGHPLLMEMKNENGTPINEVLSYLLMDEFVPKNDKKNEKIKNKI
jgi:hypothetical protein